MESLLKEDNFFSDGGDLLFASQHKYSLESLQADSITGYPLSVLKGRDSVIFQIAVLLGLAPTFQPVFEPIYACGEENEREDEYCFLYRDEYGTYDEEDENFPGFFSRFMTANRFPTEIAFLQIFEVFGASLEYFLKNQFSAYRLKYNNRIQWCGEPPTSFPTKVSDIMIYGNDSGRKSNVYVCGTLFLHIPGERHKVKLKKTTE
jgi:hypothetical protein